MGLHATDEVRFATGRAWVTSDAKVVHTLSVVDRVAVAFLDVDHDGRFDPAVEPSTHCHIREGERRCTLSARRTIAHRVRNHRITGPERVSSTPLADDLVLVGSYYRADATMDSDAQFCLVSDPSVCSIAGTDPFAKSERPAIAPCRLEAALRAPETSVRVSGDRVEQRITLPTPAPLDARFEVTWGGDARVHIDTKRPIDQAIAWLGIEGEAPRWVSELDPRTRLGAMSFDVVVPQAALDACPGCRVVVQVAAIDDAEDVGTYSEDRVTILRSGRVP